MAPVVPLTIPRGGTFEFGILYADNDYMSPYPVVKSMPSTAPVRLEVTAHGIPDGWPIRVECVKAPRELNTEENQWVFAKVIDADTIELNQLNGHCWRPYAGGGVVIAHQPVDLTGWECRAQVRDRLDGEILWQWHSDPAENPDSLILVDVDLSQFVLTMSAAQTAVLPWSKGIYEVEAIAPGGQVYKVTAISQVTITREVTT